MNKKILLNIIIAIGLVAIIIIEFVTDNSKKYFNEYECTNSAIDKDGNNSVITINFIADTTGSIVKNEYIVETKYKDKTYYENMKSYYTSNTKDKCEFNDNKYTITVTQTTKSIYSINEDETKKEVWYKDYLESLKKEYVCVKK